MSTINSIYSQNASSIYEASSLFKNSKVTGIGSNDSKTSTFKEDTLTISSEGLALLQSLSETEEPPADSNSTSKDSSENDVISQLEKLLESDKLSEEEKTDLSSVIDQLKEKLAATTTEEDASTTTTPQATDGDRPMMPPPPPQGMPPMMPPMPPMKETSEENTETTAESTTESTRSTTIVEEDNTTTENAEDNTATDRKELEIRPPYPMNIEEMINSGLLSEDQASIIKSAFASAIA